MEMTPLYYALFSESNSASLKMYFLSLNFLSIDLTLFMSQLIPGKDKESHSTKKRSRMRNRQFFGKNFSGITVRPIMGLVIGGRRLGLQKTPPSPLLRDGV